jgi:predicted PurR-regulated permease PerM
MLTMPQLESETQRARRVTVQIAGTTMTFFWSRLVVCAIVGVLTGLGYWWVGLPWAWAWGIVIGLTNTVPMLPLVAGLLPSLIHGYVHFGDLSHPIYLSAVFMVVQLLDGFVLSPLIQGKMVGLHPVTTLVLLTAGSLFFSFWGLIFAIPIAIALKIIFREYFKPRTVNFPGRVKHVDVEQVDRQE